MPSPVRFAVVRNLLVKNGWARIAGSHHIFTKAGERSFSVPVHKGLVKHGYYKAAKGFCSEE